MTGRTRHSCSRPRRAAIRRGTRSMYLSSTTTASLSHPGTSTGRRRTTQSHTQPALRRRPPGS
jgi:hypothetical protein